MTKIRRIFEAISLLLLVAIMTAVAELLLGIPLGVAYLVFHVNLSVPWYFMSPLAFVCVLIWFYWYEKRHPGAVGTEARRSEDTSAVKRWLMAFLLSAFAVLLWSGLTYVGYLNWSPVTWIMNAIDETVGWAGTLTTLFVVWGALAVTAERAMRSPTCPP